MWRCGTCKVALFFRGREGRKNERKGERKKRRKDITPPLISVDDLRGEGGGSVSLEGIANSMIFFS